MGCSANGDHSDLECDCLVGQGMIAIDGDFLMIDVGNGYLNDVPIFVLKRGFCAQVTKFFQRIFYGIGKDQLGIFETKAFFRSMMQ